ncbi:hypothetical protein EK21DRAFT_73162 [Setomelanomma holmii]|uniref:RING-type domain-containing protein n=1 Tax=Setomelanomma holmii TaxID=210430 RepID=A0A9P4H3G0_9PLEO|nr:hypothetical protein EK21DRAFT_73162 [Setomelanomma holmii]
MGTLTADCPRLDGHCPHKLATSCRLTSTLNCCACADERAHSRTYRCYIDGVGFVQRGTRWQGYCWFCKEFWTNRLAATDPPLEISQTRIPEIPDQTEFLDRWFEFHHGYRIAKLQDGTEQRMPVIGEPFKEVSPGFLPRTLDQLRAGVENDAGRPENRLRRRRLSSEEERPEEPQQSLESALEDLLAEASDDEPSRPPEERAPPPAVEAPTPDPGPRRVPIAPIRSLNSQRARERFARVFGTREDIQREDYESPLSTMFNRANARYRQAEERRATDDVYPPPPETLNSLSAQERREIEEQVLWGVMRESAAQHEQEAEGNVWSYTPRRREIEYWGLVQGQPPPEIEYDVRLSREQNYRRLNVHRAQQNATSSSSSSQAPATSREGELADYQARNATPSSSSSSSSTPPAPGMSQIQTSIQQITSELQRLRLASEAITSARHNMHARFVTPERPVQTLDNQPNRPPPMTDEEMTKTLACQVCYQQLADTAVLPCGHMVMCQWCADVVIPVKHSHLPVRPTKCPMCRKVVKQRFRIHMGS